MNPDRNNRRPAEVHSRVTSRSLLILTLLGFCSSTFAGELRVHAPVVEVEPISAPPTRVEYCSDKPSNGSLARTLAWDLGLDCRTEQIASKAITGYRVFYRWDDRVYSQVMASRPGATIPLRIRVD